LADRMSLQEQDPGQVKLSTRLDSWKEIAGHLRREIRTIQRWEKFEGLPVHRLQHQKRPSVYAFTEELDEWWRERRERLEAGSGDEAADIAIPPVAVSRPINWAALMVAGALVAASLLGILAWWYRQT